MVDAVVRNVTASCETVSPDRTTCWDQPWGAGLVRPWTAVGGAL